MRPSLLLLPLLLAATVTPATEQPDATDAPQRLHQSLLALQAEDYPQAERLAVDAARDRRQPQPRGWLVAAVACKRSGRHAEAETALRRFLATRPGDAMRRYAERQLRGLTDARDDDVPSLEERLSPLEKNVFAVVETEPSIERSEHFTVHGWNKGLLELIAREAEAEMARLREQILPAEAPIALAADIHVWPDREAYRKNAPHAPADSLGCAAPRRQPDDGHRIDLLQRNDDGELSIPMLTNVLPHEICHLMIEEFMAQAVPGRRNAARLPLAMKEGLAGLAENDGSNEQTELAGAAAAAEQHIPLEDLLDIDRYEQAAPPALFYAESYSFVDFLHSRLNRRQFGELLKHLRRGRDVHDALQRTLATPDDRHFAETLEAAWRDHAILQAQMLQILGDHNTDDEHAVATAPER
ncbi:MAG: hypothetical protein GVY16_00170 [Planctomycetes bacterium]|jgi:hypothetical protein|nr:hypothetical protein [Phycisphaerae bacterium]NBB94139.1 hypothetical protein [Planctomycetota bacterium]